MLRKSAEVVYRSRRYAGTVQYVDYTAKGRTVPKDATIFSMIQPTGKFHLGNYLGATRNWKDFCDAKEPEQKLIFGVADLHAITIPKPDVETFRRLRMEAVASILAVGVDPSKSHIMYQSQIHEHSQLHWFLSTFASMGFLNRMTQWKSKSNIRQAEIDADALNEIKLGLFSYPVLQAADILLYKSTHIPVGDDQTQHLELTRELAQRFNSVYNKKVFTLPTTLLTPAKKILSLTNPEKKMSKSDPNQNGVIYMTDEPDVIAKKIKKAVTDSISNSFYFDSEKRPGVSNLINIVAGILKKPTDEVNKDISTYTTYKELKNYVTEVIVEELKEPRNRFNELMQDPQHLNDIVDKGTEEARKIAAKNLKEIKTTMGF